MSFDMVPCLCEDRCQPGVTDEWHDVIPFAYQTGIKVLMNMVISQIIADVITSLNISFVS